MDQHEVIELDTRIARLRGGLPGLTRRAFMGRLAAGGAAGSLAIFLDACASPAPPAATAVPAAPPTTAAKPAATSAPVGAAPTAAAIAPTAAGTGTPRQGGHFIEADTTLFRVALRTPTWLPAWQISGRPLAPR